MEEHLRIRQSYPQKIVCTLLLLNILLGSCRQENGQTALETALKLAGENRQVLEQVLRHYPAKSEGHRAATYLIANMPGHDHLQSSIMDTFFVALTPTRKNTEVNKVWETIVGRMPDESKYVSDLQNIDSSFLTQQIDKALEVWHAAPWQAEIPFDHFCQFILPYKVDKEALTDWRQPLRDRFLATVDTIPDIKTAFLTLYTQIDKSFQDLYISCPHPRDPLITDKARIGNCQEKAIFITYAMRAVGIPAAVDSNCNWANYSTGAHKWVVLVLPNGTCMHITPDGALGDADTPIDASKLKNTVSFDATSVPYTVDTLKKTAKVYRHTFSLTRPFTAVSMDKMPKPFSNPHFCDVSAQYHYMQKLRIQLEDKHDTGPLYLCTFTQGVGWHPVAMENAHHGIVTFDNLGSGIVYLPCRYNGNRMVAHCNPILIQTDGSKRQLNPDFSNMESVTARRKYILTGQWIDRWAKCVGCCIEVANDSSFIDTRKLLTIHDIPFGLQRIAIGDTLAFRYLRWTTPVQDSTIRYQVPNLAEMGCYTPSDSGLVKIPAVISATGNGIDPIQDNIKVLNDNKYLSQTTWRYPYTVILDLGSNEHHVAEFRYMPATDANFVEHHQYELFYFNCQWVSVGKAYAELDELTFDNVPKGALLWLQDVTQGEEERIFTFENGRQVWW